MKNRLLILNILVISFLLIDFAGNNIQKSKNRLLYFNVVFDSSLNDIIENIDNYPVFYKNQNNSIESITDKHIQSNVSKQVKLKIRLFYYLRIISFVMIISIIILFLYFLIIILFKVMREENFEIIYKNLVVESILLILFPLVYSFYLVSHISMIRVVFRFDIFEGGLLMLNNHYWGFVLIGTLILFISNWLKKGLIKE